MYVYVPADRKIFFLHDSNEVSIMANLEEIYYGNYTALSATINLYLIRINSDKWISIIVFEQQT